MVDFKKLLAKMKRHNPKDDAVYMITQDIIDFTVDILRQYGVQKMSAEGLVYWAGKVEGNNFQITAAVAPKTETTRYGFKTSNEANAKFVEFICDNDLQYIAQVHSHPGTMIDHSLVDDEETAFRSEGLVSIVVPVFANKGMAPLHICGIHRFTHGKFPRLGNGYVKKHFIITSNGTSSILKDLRNE